MRLHPPNHRGFSLVEMLVVLTIVGILAVVGVSMIGNRQGSAVRSLMDEIEGSLTNARQAATSTGRDVALDNWGIWSASNPLVMAYGDATALTDAQIKSYALGLLGGTAPPNNAANGPSVAVVFHFMPADTTQARAEVVISGSTDWATAMGTAPSGRKNQDINTVAPFSTLAGWSGQVGDATNLITSNLTRTVISGSSQRFTNTFCIEIVGTSPSAGPMPGAAMGLIFVQANGASIYKFYNPGVLEGDGLWRKI